MGLVGYLTFITLLFAMAVLLYEKVLKPTPRTVPYLDYPPPSPYSGDPISAVCVGPYTNPTFRNAGCAAPMCASGGACGAPSLAKVVTFNATVDDRGCTLGGTSYDGLVQWGSCPIKWGEQAAAYPCFPAQPPAVPASRFLVGREGALVELPAELGQTHEGIMQSGEAGFVPGSIAAVRWSNPHFLPKAVGGVWPEALNHLARAEGGLFLNHNGVFYPKAVSYQLMRFGNPTGELGGSVFGKINNVRALVLGAYHTGEGASDGVVLLSFVDPGGRVRVSLIHSAHTWGTVPFPQNMCPTIACSAEQVGGLSERSLVSLGCYDAYGKDENGVRVTDEVVRQYEGVEKKQGDTFTSTTSDFYFAQPFNTGAASPSAPVVGTPSGSLEREAAGQDMRGSPYKIGDAVSSTGVQYRDPFHGLVIRQGCSFILTICGTDLGAHGYSIDVDVCMAKDCASPGPKGPFPIQTCGSTTWPSPRDCAGQPDRALCNQFPPPPSP